MINVPPVSERRRAVVITGLRAAPSTVYGGPVHWFSIMRAERADSAGGRVRLALSCSIRAWSGTSLTR